ncbi:MAG: hypothetical protein ACLP7Q_23355 [Isosphaeraceae bacterium]
MYHTFPPAASFWPFLLTIDQDLAETTRRHGCPCGGRLHRSNYPRKPRGDCDTLPDTYNTRFSFCCDRDGCRKRSTAPSVRFLGRKVYVGALVLLITAMRHGPSPRRVRELSALFGVDRRTIARWPEFWREYFPQTHFWKIANARLALHCNLATLPLSLLTAFVRHSDDHEGWGRLLRFLSPITTATGPPS